MASPDELLNLFASMGTTDHGTLVDQFQQVLPGSERGAAEFFLEANSWSLQAAIASFLDNGGLSSVRSQQNIPQAEFVCDVTIGEGEEIPPGTVFEKTWRLRNPGPNAWPAEVVLQYVQGEKMSGPEFVQVPSLPPGGVCDVSVHLRTPSAIGQYASSWRLCCQNGRSLCVFGEEIWVVISVAEGGTLPILQQLHHTTIEQHQQQLAVGMGAGMGMAMGAGGGGGGGMDADSSMGGMGAFGGGSDLTRHFGGGGGGGGGGFGIYSTPAGFAPAAEPHIPTRDGDAQPGQMFGSLSEHTFGGGSGGGFTFGGGQAGDGMNS